MKIGIAGSPGRSDSSAAHTAPVVLCLMTRDIALRAREVLSSPRPTGFFFVASIEALQTRLAHGRSHVRRIDVSYLLAGYDGIPADSRRCSRTSWQWYQLGQEIRAEHDYLDLFAASDRQRAAVA